VKITASEALSFDCYGTLIDWELAGPGRQTASW
jgi:FMN phosphatase YigB (HAD superfamily)